MVAHRRLELSPLPLPGSLVREGFDLASFRHRRFAAGLVCPRCGCDSVHRWGRFGARRRYRCLGCGRTFSDLTGTPLAYLKHLDRWPGFCEAVLRSLTVRRAASGLGVAVSTSFRWRHRLLDRLRRGDDVRLEGVVSVAETCFPRSEKGRRPGDRAPRGRGDPFGWLGPRVWVLLARDRPASRVWSEVVGGTRPGLRELEVRMGRRLAPGPVALRALPGMGAVKAFAGRRGDAFEVVRGDALEAHSAGLYGAQLRKWLRPFRGVATRYLRNYLVWHRFLTACDVAGRGDPAARDLLLACAFP
jgi:transposase-like protein